MLAGAAGRGRGVHQLEAVGEAVMLLVPIPLGIALAARGRVVAIVMSGAILGAGLVVLCASKLRVRGRLIVWSEEARAGISERARNLGGERVDVCGWGWGCGWLFVRTFDGETDGCWLSGGRLAGVVSRVVRLDIEQFESARLGVRVDREVLIKVLRRAVVRLSVIKQISVVVPVGLLQACCGGRRACGRANGRGPRVDIADELDIGAGWRVELLALLDARLCGCTHIRHSRTK